ncbi:MAG: hypothetical protein HY308_15335 [Gammaproteobacteria bacterium]|nr:hypothetical protein [Gammaproteobacteria bacterium]
MDDNKWRRASRLASGLSSLVVLSVAPSPLLAADWSAKPRIDVGAIRDDNIGLAIGDSESTTGYVFAGRLDLERKTERSKAKVNGSASFTKYNRDDVDDKSEQGLLVDSEYQASERGTLGFDGEYRRESLFATITKPAGTGDVHDVDVGLSTDTRVKRNYRVFNPTWNWLASERSSVNFNYRWTGADFSSAENTDLIDYTEQLFGVTYGWKVSQRDELNVTVNTSRYESDNDAESKTNRLLLGATRNFSENLSGSVSAGASRTTNSTTDDTSTGTVLSIGLKQHSDISSLEGVISRDIAPSGVGRVVRADQVRVYWTQKTSETVEFVLDAQLLKNQVIEGTDPTVDRRYYEISPQLRWQWLENLSVIGSYRVRWQKYAVDSDSADSHSIFLGLSYSL